MEVSPATGRGVSPATGPGKEKTPKENTLWPVQQKMRNLMFPAAGTICLHGPKGIFLWYFSLPGPVAGETSMGLV